MEMKYDSLYSGLVSLNKSLGGVQPMPDSEYGAMIDLMETLSNKPVGEDAFDAVSTVATMAENGELPIQGGGTTPSLKLDFANVDITANGRYEYLPYEFDLDGFAGFVANVNVPGGSRLGFRSVNINENGYQEFHATDFDLDGFSTIGIDVNVPTTGGGTDDKSWWYENGMTFANSRITSIPSWFEPDRVTNGYMFFKGASLLSTIGDLRFKNISSASYMFQQAISLETVGSLTIDYDGSDVFGLFSQCQNLSSIGSLNITPRDGRYIFQDCGKLQSVPLFDTSSTQYISGMFSGCRSLTAIPLFDFSSAIEAIELFAYCTSLKTIPQFNFSKLVNVVTMFMDCASLESLPELDFGRVETVDSLFGWSEFPNLTTVGGFRNLKASPYNFIAYCPNLTVDSLMNIINNLWDWSDNPSGVITFEDGAVVDYGTEHCLGFGETNLAKLTPEQIAVATNKGWNLG